MIGEAPFNEGLRILRVAGLSATSLIVTFDSAYGSDYFYQVYLGRTLAGVSPGVNSRAVIAQFVPSLYPEEIQILAVDPADRLTDFGALLPDRPYSRVKLRWSTTGFDPSTKLIEITAGTEPEGAVNLENRLDTEIYRGEGEYEFITDPLGPGGEWNFEVAGRDGTLPEGNRGEPLELSATITAHPPDVQGDGEERFSLSAEGGVLTVEYSLPEF